MDYNELINRINNLPKNKKFKIKDLFTGIEWEDIPISIRRSWGTRLLSEVNGNCHNNIKVLKKDTSNAQLYERI